MQGKHLIWAGVATVSAFALFSPGVASAQASSVAAQSDADSDEEIVVSARRREESLQDVPIAVTAFSGETLEERGVADLRDLANVTPAFSWGNGFGTSLGGVATIRAQAQAEPQMSLDPSVGFYIDDVYLARQSGVLATLFDIQRVEVLKGPQGTLFGRNTPGGAVVVITNQPRLGVFEGNATVSAGDYDAARVQGALNIPIGDSVALRIGGSHSEHSGYSRSSFLNEELEDENIDAWRAQALFQLSPDASFTLAYNASRADQAGVNYYLTEVDPAGLANFLTGGLFTATLAGLSDPRDNPIDAVNYEVLDTQSLAGTFNLDFSGMNLRVIAAHREMFSDVGYDNDGTPATILHLVENSVDQEQSSFEARLSGEGFDSRLNWITGVYYINETGRDIVTFNQFGAALGTFDAEIENIAYSVFAQGDYSFTDRWSATLGLRLGHDERGVVGRHTTDILAGPGAGLTVCQFEVGTGINVDEATGGCRSDASAEFDNYAYQIGLNYQATDDLLFYVTHRRGYRSGVINERATEAAGQAPFDPEVILDLEAGVKSSWRSGDWRGIANLAVYYSRFSDRQISFTDFTPAGGATTVIEAAAEAHTSGFELELAAHYSDWLDLWAGVAHTSPEYDEFSRRASSTFPTGLDVSGQVVANTPNWQYNVGGRITHALGRQFGSLFGQVDYQYTGEQQFGFNPRPSAGDDGHGILNVSTGLEDIHSGRARLTLFVRNALDEDYVAQALSLGFTGDPGTAAFGYATASLGPPRTYGVELAVRF